MPVRKEPYHSVWFFFIVNFLSIRAERQLITSDNAVSNCDSEGYANIMTEKGIIFVILK